MSSKQIDLGGQLRTAIARSGLNRFQLAKQSGVPYSVIHGFVSGEVGLTLTTASRICQVIGMQLQPTRQKGNTGKRGR